MGSPKFLPRGKAFLSRRVDLGATDEQAGCYQLVSTANWRIRAPDGWSSSPPQSASERGVHFAMPRPLRNRFVHLELEAD